MHLSYLQGMRIISRATGGNRGILIQFLAPAGEISVLQSIHTKSGPHPHFYTVDTVPFSSSKTFQPINTHLLNCPCIWFRFSTRMGNLKSHVPTMFWTLNSKNFTWKQRNIYSTQKWYNAPSYFFKAKYFNINSPRETTNTHTNTM